jgi:hypothetical protein
MYDKSPLTTSSVISPYVTVSVTAKGGSHWQTWQRRESDDAWQDLPQNYLSQFAVRCDLQFPQRTGKLLQSSNYVTAVPLLSVSAPCHKMCNTHTLVDSV